MNEIQALRLIIFAAPIIYYCIKRVKADLQTADTEYTDETEE